MSTINSIQNISFRRELIKELLLLLYGVSDQQLRQLIRYKNEVMAAQYKKILLCLSLYMEPIKRPQPTLETMIKDMLPLVEEHNKMC